LPRFIKTRTGCGNRGDRTNFKSPKVDQTNRRANFLLRGQQGIFVRQKITAKETLGKLAWLPSHRDAWIEALRMVGLKKSAKETLGGANQIVM
jgi:hypothetical protein